MFETIIATLTSTLPPAIVAGIAAGFIRNLAGWIENAWKDGKVDKYEWKKLGGTMVKYFAGIWLFSMGLPVPEAIAVMFGADIFAGAVKKAGNRE